MRDDLTADFLAAMSAPGRRPLTLAIFHFDAGDVLVADRDVTIGGELYQGIVESWGNLITVGGTSAESNTANMSMTLWNGGQEPFSNYFSAEDPMDVFVDVYQTFDGLTAADMAIIGNFVIQDPIEYNERNYLLTLDLVSTNMRYYAQVGYSLTREFFPDALETDLNKSVDLLVGNVGTVQALCVSSPPRCETKGSILKLPTVLNVWDDLDDLGFSQSGYIQIDAEIMKYSSRGTSFFTISARGQSGTIATDHSDGSVVIQAGESVEYLVGLGPISSITNVKVGGQTPNVPYTVHPEENPAVIRFTKQPTYYEYSRGARSANIELDSVGAANTARQPHYAYDLAFRSYGALISKVYRTLSLMQIDAPEDDGELVRVFLNVEHWSTKAYLNDYVAVWVEGIGTVGKLSRPNPADYVEASGVVDLDHTHDHVDGGLHEHGFTNPTIATTDLSHLHTATVAGVTSQESASYYKPADNVWYQLPVTFYTYDKTKIQRFKFTGRPGAAQQSLALDFLDTGNSDKIVLDIDYEGGGVKRLQWTSANRVIVTIALDAGRYASGMTITSYGGKVYNGYITVNSAVLTTTMAGGVNYNTSNVAASLPTVGDVKYNQLDTTGTPLKDADDVIALTEADRVLKLTTTSSTNEIYDRFDLTKHLATITWSWLTNREIRLVYTGSANDAEIVVPYVYFEVEYRQKSISTSDDITAEVVGSIENRPDAVIQYLLTEKAGVPLDKLGSVSRSINTWSDALAWDDLEVWRDEGQTAGVPSGALFDQAGAWYNYHGYRIDGVIPGNLSVKEAVFRLTWQTRAKIYWQSGKVALAIMRQSEEWTIAKNLDKYDFQLRSLSVSRSPANEIINRIDLYYDLDRLSLASGAEAYNASASQTDLASIEKHGEKKDDENFQFDYIRDATTAEETAAYYLWLLGETITRITATTYLPNFDLEKSDYVRITSAFARMSGVPCTIRDIQRIFGSGKNKIINQIRLFCESIRYRQHDVFVNDEVTVDDVIDVHFKDLATLGDYAFCSDILEIVFGREFVENLTVSDTLKTVADFRPSKTETVLLSDILTTSISAYLFDTVTVSDKASVSTESCFGMCGFGAPGCVGVKFGSRTQYMTYGDDMVDLSDVLESDIGVGLAELAVASDSLTFGDGFGSAACIGDGFGRAPFGDTNC